MALFLLNVFKYLNKILFVLLIRVKVKQKKKKKMLKNKKIKNTTKSGLILQLKIQINDI